MKRPKLTQHLEWHGRKIRVVVRVPPSLVSKLGHHLRQTLPTDSPKAASILKFAVVGRMKARIQEARAGGNGDTLVEDALLWRSALKDDEERWARGEIESTADMHARDGLEYRAEAIEQTDGHKRAEMFLSIALGTATPLDTFFEAWTTSKRLADRTIAAYRGAFQRLRVWLEKDGIPPVLEAVTSKITARFVSEVYELPRMNPATANKEITGLSSYWAWLLKAEHLDTDKHKNVWLGRRLKKESDHQLLEEVAKRPFTNLEISTLIAGVTVTPLKEACHIAALSGMRLGEIASMRVRDINEGSFAVMVGKTPQSRRRVPMHPDLIEVVEALVSGKSPGDFLLNLPSQKTTARGRGAPITQAFTRARRSLTVDDHPTGRRQSRIDFHSFRRWFIRRAVEALEDGATGFTPWTIADVVGHSKDEQPLPMTMGRYPGRASEQAMLACVNAVTLPPLPAVASR